MVNTLIEDMEEERVIEPSKCAWVSTIVLVKKRMILTTVCVVYRKLNEVTLKDSYARINDTLDNVSSAKWFSTLYMKSGYWCVKLYLDNNEKTAFAMGHGL